MNEWTGLSPLGLVAVILGAVLSVELFLRLPVVERVSRSARDLLRVGHILRSKSAPDSSKQRAARLVSSRLLVAGFFFFLACVVALAPLGVGALIAVGDAGRILGLFRNVPLLVCVTATISGYVLLRKIVLG